MLSHLRLFLAALGGISLVAVDVAAQSVREPGLIGKRYAGPDFTYDEFNGSAVDRALGAGAVLNLPASPAFDVVLGYNYADASGPGYDAIDRAVSGSVLTHRMTEYGRAYFAGTLGHSWHRIEVLNTGTRDDGAFWGVRAGYEIALGRATAVNAGLGYSRAFDTDVKRNQALRYSAELNHWLSPDLAGVVSASYRQIKQAPDAVAFTAGLRWTF